MNTAHAWPATGLPSSIHLVPSQPEDSASLLSVDLVAAALRSEDLAGIAADELARDARDYERFLQVARDNPDRSIAPTKAIDRMWHLHMLHPRAYVADCLRLFGEILDHDGGFGGTPEEAPILAETFAATGEIWARTFGEAYLGSAVKCTRNCVSRCSRRCKTDVSDPELGSVRAATRLAKRRYADRLVVLPSAEASARASAFRDPERIFRVLTLLALFGHDDRVLRENLERVFGRAAKWKSKDSPQTVARFGDTRRWKGEDGVTKLFGRHVTVGGSVDPERCLQVYYDVMTDGRVEVAWVGEHRPTVSRDV